MTNPINHVLNKFADVRIMLLGDIMLDKYVYGNINRISPEAPIPVLRHLKEKNMLGGAGNVFCNLIALSGKQHVLFSVAGDDEYRIHLENLLINTAKYHLYTEADRKTTVKQRLIAQRQQMIRYDIETASPIGKNLQNEILSDYAKELEFVDAVILSDYNKGFFNKDFTQEIICLAKKAGKMILVDPKSRDFSFYAGADFVKPNRNELTEAAGEPVQTIDEITAASRSLCQKHSIGNIIVTLSEEGMLYVPGNGGRAVHIKPQYTPEIFDVSGAGDTAFAVLALSLASGAEIETALHTANTAAQIAISKAGTATVSPEEIIRYVHSRAPETSGDNMLSKIVSLPEAKKIVREWKNNGETVCFTNGCFDLLHYGHISSFLQTKKHGDKLIVALNSDISVKRNKGEHRPIQDEKTRASLLAVLQCVDLVIIFDDDTALRLVDELRPDVLAKEGYPLEKWQEARYAQSYGCKIVFLKREEGYSTTKLTDKIAAKKELANAE